MQMPPLQHLLHLLVKAELFANKVQMIHTGVELKPAAMKYGRYRLQPKKQKEGIKKDEKNACKRFDMASGMYEIRPAMRWAE